MEKEQVYDQGPITQEDICRILEDLDRWDREFRDGIVARKHMAFIKGFSEFAFERVLLPKEEAVDFLNYYRSRKKLLLLANDDPSEKVLISAIFPATLAAFVRTNLDCLTYAAGNLQVGSEKHQENQVMIVHWRRIGETIRLAHFIDKLTTPQ